MGSHPSHRARALMSIGWARWRLVPEAARPLLQGGRLVIAHRAETLAFCDRVIRLQAGRVEQS